jgi:hypothetical protein
MSRPIAGPRTAGGILGDEVARLAGVLADLGVVKGDRY